MTERSGFGIKQNELPDEDIMDSGDEEDRCEKLSLEARVPGNKLLVLGCG